MPPPAAGINPGPAATARRAHDLNQTFDQRYRAIETFGPDDTQGQPMFS